MLPLALLRVGGAIQPWLDLGFTGTVSIRIDTVFLYFAGGEPLGLLAWGLEGTPGPDDVDGVPTEWLGGHILTLGPVILEVVARAGEAGEGPASLWGFTVVVEDLDALAARLGDRLGPVKDAVQPGRRIATVRREAGLGVPLAFMSA